MAKRQTKLKNENPLSDAESLYNIYTLSFHNIMGSASVVERGRFMLSLRRLEERVQDILEEYRLIRIDRLSLVRRSLDAYSTVSWRIPLEGSNRRFVSLTDETAAQMLASAGDFEREQILTLDREVQLLNANLKIEWTMYLEHCRLTNPPEDERLAPTMMPRIIAALS